MKCGDIESNPGPELILKPLKLEIISYNVRGLKEYSKLKRVLNSCAKLIRENKNTIICLQETYLERGDENKIKVMWKGNYTISPAIGRSRGCITLFDSSWEKIESVLDPSGRFAIVTLRKNFGIY